jgi:hypothetical protein
MSTNYYLINKKDVKIANQFNKLIAKQVEKLANKLLDFGEKNNLSYFPEDVADKMRTIQNELSYGLFSSEGIHICRTTGNTIMWNMNEYFSNEYEFVEFFENNKDKYEIQSEYKEVLILDEFINNVINDDWEEVKYIKRRI